MKNATASYSVLPAGAFLWLILSTISIDLAKSMTNWFNNLITFLICSVIIILLIVALSFKAMDKLFFTLIIGGALGNFYDRLIFKAVPDFIDLHYNGYHWFTFNVADIFITMGIIGYLINGSLRT